MLLSTPKTQRAKVPHGTYLAITAYARPPTAFGRHTLELPAPPAGVVDVHHRRSVAVGAQDARRCMDNILPADETAHCAHKDH